MVRNSDHEWEKLGAVEPYWGVLSNPKYRSNSITEDAIEDFFESGQRHVDFLFSTIHDHICPDFRSQRALDFGCGVGRILVPLSMKCEQVTGVDISESMLAEARKNCRERGIANVELVKSTTDLNNLSGEFDFVHSDIVFQHIPSHKGENLLREFLSRVSEQGIVAIQFSCKDRRSALRRAINWAQKSVPFVHIAANLIKGRPWGFPYIDMNYYSLNRVLALIHEHGCLGGEVTIRIIDKDGTLGAFVFFQKGGNLEIPR
jgi:2-polyprenyl-3-methyl-5-hydroxy-6-metoxy-1,4-benzoquinol methylase